MAGIFPEKKVISFLVLFVLILAIVGTMMITGQKIKELKVIYDEKEFSIPVPFLYFTLKSEKSVITLITPGNFEPFKLFPGEGGDSPWVKVEQMGGASTYESSQGKLTIVKRRYLSFFTRLDYFLIISGAL